MRIKAIKGYEGTYAVSDDGRVFNIRSGNELKQKNNNGYFTVTLCSNKKRRNTEYIGLCIRLLLVFLTTLL